jgi:general secretion pathway protein N
MRGATALTTRWLESTLEVARWENMRRSGRRWGWWGASVGASLGLVVYAPAAWLAQGLTALSDGKLLLADASGTIWHGDAVAVLTGGRGSRDARALPGRLGWSMRIAGGGLRLALQQDCCLPTPLVVQLNPRWSGVQVQLGTQPLADAPMQAFGEMGHWPAAWLGGLGTPWNTLQLGGVLRLAGQDLSFEWVKGRLRMAGRAEVTLDNASSPITTLERLGSYRLNVDSDPDGQVQLRLGTLDGALQIMGSGGVTPTGMRLRGEARASEANPGALDNLLNIIGRREGERSVISIG